MADPIKGFNEIFGEPETEEEQPPAPASSIASFDDILPAADVQANPPAQPHIPELPVQREVPEDGQTLSASRSAGFHNFSGVYERGAGIFEGALSIATSMGSSLLAGGAAIAGLGMRGFDELLSPEGADEALFQGQFGKLLALKAAEKARGVEPIHLQAPVSDLFMSIYTDTQQEFTYVPERETGKNIVNKTSELLNAPGQFLGDVTFETFAGLPEQARATMAAAATIVPDAAMTLAGLRLARSQNTIRATTAQTAADFPRRPLATTAGGASPAGFDAGVMKLEALERLPGAEKPRFRSAEEAAQYIDDVANNRTEPVVVVETSGGAPVRILSGVSNIHLMRSVNDSGNFRVQDVKVLFKEKVKEVSDADLAQEVNDAQKAFRAFEESAEAAQKFQTQENRTLFQKLRDLAVDASGTVKSELLENGGETGARAVMMYELIAGAHPRAYLKTQDMHNAVYKGLGFGKKYEIPGIKSKKGETLKLSERDLLDLIIVGQRRIAISKTKGGKTKKTEEGQISITGEPEFTGGAKARDFGAALRQMERALPSELYVELLNRAKRHFDFASEVLVRMRDSGLISSSEFRRMRNIDYLKTKFLNRIIDPVDPKLSQPGISVGESGIQHFKGGSQKAAFVDTEALLTEHLLRVESRIAKNQANQELFKLADTMPDNGVVKKPTRADAKVPQGWEELRVRVEGKTQRIWMRDYLAEQWVSGNQVISPVIANLARIASGTAILKPLATGYNPGFILTNLPRDLSHAWLATGSNYSTVLPVYLGQIARDMGATFRDAATKTGKYKDFINEGGGMNFLTHQGRDIFASREKLKTRFKKTGSIRAKGSEYLNTIKESLSYLNELSEIWIRLAIRERVLRNQQVEMAQGLRSKLDPIAATYVARNYLDFSQGGSFTKAADNIVPYLNAASQALRTTVNAHRKNPKQTVLKDLQLVTLGAGWAAYNWLQYNERHEQIPAETRYTNYIIHHDLFYIDEDGNKRWAYTPIRKDESTLVFTAPFEMLVDRFFSRRPPEENLFKIMAKGIPSVSGLIPTMQAYQTYMANHNFWFDDKVWRGRENLEPSAEFTENTDPIFKDIGKLTGMSPERMQAAMRALVPNNTYIGIGQFSYSFFNEYLNDPEMQQPAPNGYTLGENQISTHTGELLKEAPIIRRAIKWTHPATVEIERAMNTAASPTTIDELARRELNILIRDGRIDEATAFVASQPDPALAQSLARTLKSGVRVDAIFETLKKPDDKIPTKLWWVYMDGQSSTRAQAAVFYNEWLYKAPEQRRKMETLAGALVGPNSTFWYYLGEEKERQGTERPGAIID